MNAYVLSKPARYTFLCEHMRKDGVPPLIVMKTEKYLEKVRMSLQLWVLCFFKKLDIQTVFG